MNQTQTITYTRLRSGDWGLRVEGSDVNTGDSVLVSKKSGQVNTETVGRVIWRTEEDGGVSICSIGPRSNNNKKSQHSEFESERFMCADDIPY